MFSFILRFKLACLQLKALFLCYIFTIFLSTLFIYNITRSPPICGLLFSSGLSIPLMVASQNTSGLLALHFNKLELCCYCRFILIFIVKDTHNCPNLETRIRHSLISNPILLIYRIWHHLLPKQGNNIIFTTPHNHMQSIQKLCIHIQSIRKSPPHHSEYILIFLHTLCVAASTS